MDANVVSMEELVKKKKKEKQEKTGDSEESEPKPKPVSKAPLYHAVCEAFNRTVYNALPEPDVRIAVFEPSRGVRVAIQIGDDDVCVRIPIASVVSLISDYLKTKRRGIPEYIWEYRHMVECAKLWLASTKPIPEPTALRFQTEKGLCFHRIPFDPIPDPDHIYAPHWTAMFKRIRNGKALKAWIGSLFIANSYRQQYVWLYGQGGDGKGALQRFLGTVFSEEMSVSFQGAPLKTNKHWGWPFVGKRLGLFTEFEDYAEMNKGIMKAITGGDRIFVDPKGSAGYSVDLIIKLMLASNDLPTIDSKKASLRRIIFCEFLPLDKDTPLDSGIEKELMKEAPYFIWDCLTTFAAVCPDPEKEIPVDSDVHDELAGWANTLEVAHNDNFETFLEENFVLDPDAVEMPAGVHKRVRFQWPDHPAKRTAFLAWLWKKHSVREKSQRIPGSDSPRWAYRGIKLKE